MGVTYVEAKVTGSTGESQTVRFLVDSGAKYSLLPPKVWRALGLKPKREMDFVLADGTVIKRKVSECLFSYQGVEAHSPVILGQRGDEALLGAVTLETLGLVLNPFDRTLQPARMVLA